MRVLALNAGSSSLKYALYESNALGLTPIEEGNRDAGDASHGAGLVSAVIVDARAHGPIDAVAHRIVFGGPEHDRPAIVTPALLEQLRALIPYDPLHLGPELGAVDAVAAALPGIPLTLSFDTAFFAGMPETATLLPLPHGTDPMVRRYGFHGISYGYIASTFDGRLPGRTIIAHLGSGASMAALLDGAPVDTTMAFTPLGGLMMGTRAGDIDPGAVLWLLQAYGGDQQRLSNALYRECGLLGVSGTSADMRTLLAAESTDPNAARAVALFVHTARRFVGALAAVLGGLDRFIFTGGIGENSAPIRERIISGLDYLWGGAPVDVRVIPTNENLMLARAACELLSTNSHQSSSTISD